MSMGSAAETEYHLLLSRHLGYLPPETHAEMDGLLSETKRMLSALLAKVHAAGS